MKAKIKLNKYKNNIISISGSKNSSLPIIAASILCDEYLTLNNIPNIKDVTLLIDILRNLGQTLIFKNNTLTIYPHKITTNTLFDSNISKLRGSYYLIGSIIGSNKECDFSIIYPGGCTLGSRPINFHINAFRKMGLLVNTKKEKIHFEGNIHPTIHDLDYPSVGTTINIILASIKLEGITIINNCAVEPEIIDLINFLNSMGANISISNHTIIINGVNYLHSTNYTVSSDRIEAGTFLILGALHNGITIKNINPNDIYSLINLLHSINIDISMTNNSVTIHKNKELKPFNLVITPYPGFPTDLGPLICVLATQINGTSTIKDTVYKTRNSHIKELNKMNCLISCNKNKISIEGISKIKNKTIKAYDLRCCASLILAASLNNKFTTIKNIDYIFRGYENIKDKLNSLGIDFIV